MGIADRAEDAAMSDDEIIKELSGLPPIEYDRIRATKAKDMGCRPGTLDKLVAQARDARTASEADADAKGRAISLHEPEPWPDPVDGSAVLDDALCCLSEYMSIHRYHAVACVLWAAHAHVFDAFAHTPRLAITAPDAECGKTLLMQLLGALVPRPQPVEIMKAAPFFRMAEQYKPVFLIDETDVFIKDDSDLLAAINNGWEPHGGVLRCVGDDFEVRHFSTHTPVIVGGIKLHKVLPNTTISRSLVISLERATEGEIKKQYDKRKDRSELLVIGRKLKRWCSDNRERFITDDPNMPNGSFNRRADKWRPLFSIAEAAGGKWVELARRAYMAEDGDSSKAKVSTALQLLIDISQIFDGKDDSLHTHEMIDLLCRIDESQWEDYNFKERDIDRRKIQPRQVAALLQDYQVRPRQIWRRGKNERGYRRTDLEIAWKRYATPILSAKSLEPTAGAGSSDFSSVRANSDIADKKPLKATADAGSSRLADKTPPTVETRDSSRDRRPV